LGLGVAGIIGGELRKRCLNPLRNRFEFFGCQAGKVDGEESRERGVISLGRRRLARRRGVVLIAASGALETTRLTTTVSLSLKHLQLEPAIQVLVETPVTRVLRLSGRLPVRDGCLVLLDRFLERLLAVTTDAARVPNRRRGSQGRMRGRTVGDRQSQGAKKEDPDAGREGEGPAAQKNGSDGSDDGPDSRTEAEDRASELAIHPMDDKGEAKQRAESSEEEVDNEADKEGPQRAAETRRWDGWLLLRASDRLSEALEELLLVQNRSGSTSEPSRWFRNQKVDGRVVGRGAGPVLRSLMGVAGVARNPAMTVTAPMVGNALNDDVERLAELGVDLLPSRFLRGRVRSILMGLFVFLASGGLGVGMWVAMRRRPTLVERGATASRVTISWRRGTSLALALVLTGAGTVSGKVPRRPTVKAGAGTAACSVRTVTVLNEDGQTDWGPPRGP
jgi:hypothetical protein